LAKAERSVSGAIMPFRTFTWEVVVFHKRIDLPVQPRPREQLAFAGPHEIMNPG
jgi:hypothetical protein